MKGYRIAQMDVREMVSGMSTSQLVTMIAAHAARVEMARSAAGPMLLPYETQEAEAACVELDTLALAALEETHCSSERFVELLRTRQTEMAERRVRALRWSDVCELGGVDPWRVVARPQHMSLGAALAKLELEAVRLEVRS